MNNTNNNLTPPATQFDARITSALEHKPEPQIPSDFAAKVAARAAAQPLRRHSSSTPRFGSAIALFSIPFAALALFFLAPHTAPNLHSLGFDIELALVTELALIGGWIGHTFTGRHLR